MIKELKISQSITPRDSQSLVSYFNEISAKPLLTPDEEVELAYRIKNGDSEARNELVQANLRFVVSVAKQYQSTGMALEDLINEGNIGLIRAAERFDPTRGFKFDTFAVWWIRQAITTSLADTGRTIRLPLNAVGLVSRIRKADSEFEQKYERLPTNQELSEMLDVPIERIESLRTHLARPMSIDAPVSDESETTVGDLLITGGYEATDHLLIHESLRHDLLVALGTLPEREARVLRLYFGLDAEALSLDDIALQLHLTRERVRQLRERALRILFKRSKGLLRTYVS